MAEPAYAVDTNILLCVAQPGSPYDTMVVSALSKLTARDAMLHYTSQSAAEFWAISTTGAGEGGVGIDAQEAERRLALIERRFVRLPDTDATYREWRRLVSEYAISGARAHDARLVAAMLSHGVHLLLTLNIDDFGAFSAEITAVHPRALAEHREDGSEAVSRSEP
jgi:predicted nucleic acid-binding protein